MYLHVTTGISGVLMPHEAAHLVASRAIPLLQQHSRLGAAVRLLRAALPLLITRPLPPFSRNSARAEGAAPRTQRHSTIAITMISLSR